MGSFNLSVSGPQIDDAVINGLDKDLSKLSETGKKVIDGNWVYNTFQIVENGTWEATGYNYDLSSYLPNDGYTYEVGISGQASSIKNQKGFMAFIRPLHMPKAMQFLSAGILDTSSTFSYTAFNTVTVPVDSTRTVRFGLTSNGTATNSVIVWCWGYRRVGTNQ